jgi:hypothetical protein
MSKPTKKTSRGSGAEGTSGANDGNLILLTRPAAWGRWAWQTTRRWVEAQIGSELPMPALRQIERSWDSLDPQDWTEFLWDGEADRLLSPPTDALEYLRIALPLEEPVSRGGRDCRRC